MSKRTVVSDYIQNKLENIKKDSFLSEIANKSVYEQQKLIIDEVEAIRSYIKLIKLDDSFYIKIDNKEYLDKNIKDYIKSLNKIISNYQEYSKCIKLLDRYDKRGQNIDLDLDDDITLLSEEQYNMIESYNLNTNELSFDDAILMVKYMIENYDSFDNHGNLYKMLRRINDELVSSNTSLEEKFIAVNSIKNTIDYKVNELEKDSVKRKELKNLKKYLKSMITMCSNEEEKEHDYRYDIIDSLILDDYYFNRIVEEIPDIINTTKYGHTLAYNTLFKYLDSYSLELMGKQPSIPKEKYKQVYQSIIFNPNYDSSNHDQIDNLLNMYKEMISSTKMRRARYIEVLEDLDRLHEQVEEPQKQDYIDKDEMYYESMNILNYKSSLNREDLTDENTVVFASNNGVNNYAYSLIKKDDGYTFKLHITDVYEYIKISPALESFLRKQQFKNDSNWLPKEVLQKLSLSDKGVKPAITFSIDVDKRGRVSDFKCYKSDISIKKIYSFKQIDELLHLQDRELLDYLKLYNYLNREDYKTLNSKNLTSLLNNIIINKTCKYFSSNNLPFIYKVQPKQAEGDYVKRMSELNALFSKISQEDFAKIYSIICEDINYAKYSNKPTFHYSLNKKYYTDLLNPLYSYIGIYLQELINLFYFSSFTKEEKDAYFKEVDEIINEANNKKAEIRKEDCKGRQKKLN